MGYRRIPAYNTSLRVSPETAKQDRVNIVLGDWILGPTGDADLMMFFANLAPAEIHESLLGLAPTSLSVSDPWFTRGTHFDPTCPTLMIRQGGRGHGLRAGRPLVTGQLISTRFRRQPGDSYGEGPVSRKINLNLSLNPTRFLHHQPTVEWVTRRSIPVEDWDLPEPRLIAQTAHLHDIDERSLDGNDNVLLGRARMSYSKGAAWPLHLRRYWEGLLHKFDDIFHEAASLAILPVQFRSTANLRSIETYWEFHVNDPSAWLLEIEPVLRRLGLSSEARNFQYPEGYSGDAITGNSRSIVVKIRSGVWLRVYAKTTHRVRFEVEHDLVENARPIGGSHTSDDLNMFFQWANLAADDAALHVNSALEQLERHQTRQGAQMSVTQLIIAVTQALDDPSQAEIVLELLAANQAITAPTGSGLRTSIRKLVSRSILEAANPRGRIYALSPKFSEAGRRLGSLARSPRSREF